GAAELRLYERHHGRQQRQPAHRPRDARRRARIRQQYRRASERVPVPARFRRTDRECRGRRHTGSTPQRLPGDCTRRRDPRKRTLKMAATREYIEQNRERFREELFEFLRIPSVSARREHKADTRRAAEWLKGRLDELGLTTSLHETPGHPILLAEYRDAGTAAPTVLVYGHYDGQPAEPLELWTTPLRRPAAGAARALDDAALRAGSTRRPHLRARLRR